MNVTELDLWERGGGARSDLECLCKVAGAPIQAINMVAQHLLRTQMAVDALSKAAVAKDRDLSRIERAAGQLLIALGVDSDDATIPVPIRRKLETAANETNEAWGRQSRHQPPIAGAELRDIVRGVRQLKDWATRATSETERGAGATAAVCLDDLDSGINVALCELATLWRNLTGQRIARRIDPATGEAGGASIEFLLTGLRALKLAVGGTGKDLGSDAVDSRIRRLMVTGRI